MLQFSTPRLHIRLLMAADAAAIVDYRSDEHVARYVPWATPYALQKAHDLIARNTGRDFDTAGESGLIMAVELRATGEFIGDAMIEHVGGDARQGLIGYALARPFHNQGFGTELTKGLIARFFASPGAHRVTAWCDARNAASIRVLEKAGMRQEAELVQGVFCKGEWVNERLYAVLKSEWLPTSACLTRES